MNYLTNGFRDFIYPSDAIHLSTISYNRGISLDQSEQLRNESVMFQDRILDSSSLGIISHNIAPHIDIFHESLLHNTLLQTESLMSHTRDTLSDASEFDNFSTLFNSNSDNLGFDILITNDYLIILDGTDRDYLEFEIFTDDYSRDNTKGLPIDLIKALPEKKASDSNHFCSICLETYKKDESLTVLPCNHCYHKLCIQIWLEKNSNCPECRLNITF